MDLYADNILEHFRNPVGKGVMENPSVAHEETNPSCGDEVTVFLEVEGDIIQSVQWEGVGCAISQAATSMLTEELEGLSLADAEGITKQDIFDLLGVPISLRRTKCALLGLHAIKNAIRKVQGAEPQGWLETVEV